MKKKIFISVSFVAMGRNKRRPPGLFMRHKHPKHQNVIPNHFQCCKGISYEPKVPLNLSSDDTVNSFVDSAFGATFLPHLGRVFSKYCERFITYKQGDCERDVIYTCGACLSLVTGACIWETESDVHMKEEYEDSVVFLPGKVNEVDPLVKSLALCIKKKHFSTDSLFYKFLSGLLSPISEQHLKGKKVFSTNSIRYNQYTQAICVVLKSIGGARLFRFLRGDAWENRSFKGILPLPNVSTIDRWKSKQSLHAGVSVDLVTSIIEQFSAASPRDSVLYFGLSFDEMDIKEGFLVDRSSQMIRGRICYKSEGLVISENEDGTCDYYWASDGVYSSYLEEIGDDDEEPGVVVVRDGVDIDSVRTIRNVCSRTKNDVDDDEIDNDFDDEDFNPDSEQEIEANEEERIYNDQHPAFPEVDDNQVPLAKSDQYYNKLLKDRLKLFDASYKHKLPATKIQAHYLNLHNASGKGVRVFCGYFAVGQSGHGIAGTEVILLQMFQAIAIAKLKREAAHPAQKLRFCSIVMDGDSSHRGLFSSKGLLPVKNGYFYCPFLNCKVYYFQDPEHLVKRYRGQFAQSATSHSTFKLLKGGICSWQFLLALVESEQRDSARASLLNPEDVVLTSRSKMKTTHARNVMKPVVRQALLKKFGGDVKPFCEALKIGYLLLEIFRSHNPFKLDNDKNIQSIENIRQFFRDWRKEDHTEFKRDNPKCTSHSYKLHSGIYTDMEHTCNSLLGLYTEARDNGIKIIPRTISQNPVENLFSLIRSFCGSISNPTLQQAIGALSSIINLQSFKGTTKGASYSLDTVKNYSARDAIASRHEKLTKTMEEFHKDLKFDSITDELILHRQKLGGDVSVVIQRIALGIPRKKNFKVKEGSTVLLEMVQYAFERSNDSNFSEFLPRKLNLSLTTKYRKKFKESLSNDCGKNINSLLQEVIMYISTISISEYLHQSNKKPNRGAKSLRNWVPDLMKLHILRSNTPISTQEIITSLNSQEIEREGNFADITQHEVIESNWDDETP